jgi:hypothetical protein
MIEFLILLLVLVIVFVIISYCIDFFLPGNPINRIIKLILGLICVLYLLSAIGGFAPLPSMRFRG